MTSKDHWLKKRKQHMVHQHKFVVRHPLTVSLQSLQQWSTTFGLVPVFNCLKENLMDNTFFI